MASPGCGEIASTIASMTAQVLQGALRLTHALGGRNDAMGRAADKSSQQIACASV